MESVRNMYPTHLPASLTLCLDIPNCPVLRPHHMSISLSAVSFLSLPELLLNLVTFREGDGTPLQSSCLANPMNGGAWWAAVHGVTKSQTRLSDFTLTFHFHALEKEMATHSSILAWRIPGTGEPGGVPSMGLHRVRHD